MNIMVQILAPLFGGLKQFPVLSKILMGHYNHSLLFDAKIMVSLICPMTSIHAVIIFVRQKVTVATKLPAEPPLILALSIYISKMVQETHVNYQILISWIGSNFGFIHMILLLLQATFYQVERPWFLVHDVFFKPIFVNRLHCNSKDISDIAYCY